MELLDYLRMLRRGWLTILVVTLIGVCLAGAYVSDETQQYSSSAVVLVSPDSPRTISDLQLGAQYSTSAAPTYAAIISSPRVLGPVADRLGGESLRDLEGAVTAVATEGSGLIVVTATAGSPNQATQIAAAVAQSAVTVIPDVTSADSGLPGTPTSASGAPLISLKIIQTAREPDGSDGVSASRIVVLGLLVGLALGVALTITLQSLDTRLRRPEDVLEVSDVPLLAVIPKLRRRQLAGVVVRDESTGGAVEAFRSLRTNVSHVESGRRRSLLVTSVNDTRLGPQVAVNLAWSIALAGRRVLLMDLDLRNSPIAPLLELDDEVGVGDVLAGAAPLGDSIRQVLQHNLYVALAGRPQASPSDLLSGPGMVDLLRQVETGYDYVVLYAPPLLGSSDAAVVSRMAHTLVTVSADRTRAVDLDAAMAALANVRVEPLGLVLTGARGPLGAFARVRGGRAARVAQTSAPTEPAHVLQSLPPGQSPAKSRRRASS